jgi:quinolinate synthase
VPEFNKVKPGDVVDEFVGSRTRFDASGQQWVVTNARRALEKMISITESR